MRKLLIISAITACMSQAFAQAPFEGVLTFKAENKTISETSTVNWFVKGGNSMLEINSVTKEANANMSLYFVKGQNGVKMVSQADGGTAVYDVPYSAFAKTDFSDAFSVEATGNKGNYGGFACEEYLIQTPEATVNCWVSNATGVSSASFPAIVLGKGIFAVLQRNGIQGIPVKIVSKDYAGNIILDQELVSVQATPVADAKFVVPAGTAK